MPTYILTWNPSKWLWNPRDYARDVRQNEAGKLVSRRWSCGNRTNIVPGDRLFLMRQGTDRGLISSGYATSESYEDEHWDESRDDQALYVDYKSEMLLKTDDRLPIEGLLREGLGVPWNNLYGSGVAVPVEWAPRLEQIWQDHLVNLGRQPDRMTLSDLPASTANSNRNEDLVLRQIVQRRGQPLFRAQLIEAYGGQCAVTGCDTEAALEAAHILPYDGPSSNRVSNGLLLRGDVHTLFDLALMGINAQTLTVVCSEHLTGAHYQELHGKKVRLPRDNSSKPSKRALQQRWRSFLSYK
jgi:hypothetical protein